ncbi:MAG: hypothetical protein GY847_09300 [Proteobacteria bacterium]|nr:hypothetical protein [Pseudomonadota bacterium]
MLERYGIRSYFTSPTTRHKAYLAERQIRTLRQGLGRFKAAGHTSSLPQVLRRLEDYWNGQRINVKTGKTPDKTTNADAPRLLRDRRLLRSSNRSDLRVGDRVLVKKSPYLFAKSSDPSFYTTIYVVAAIKRAEPRDRYYLKTVAGTPASGSFSVWQLTKVH